MLASTLNKVTLFTNKNIYINDIIQFRDSKIVQIFLNSSTGNVYWILDLDWQLEITSSGASVQHSISLSSICLSSASLAGQQNLFKPILMLSC